MIRGFIQKSTSIQFLPGCLAAIVLAMSIACNTSRIRIEGNKVTHWLNGNEILSYTFGSVELLTAYENSKFADIAGFIDKRKGHIVLQDHITEAWFRDIRIKKL